MTAIERLYSLLQLQNKKPADLCRFLEITSSVLANWKTTSEIPPAKYLVRISDFLNVSINYLLTGEEYNVQTYSSNGDKAFLKPNDSELSDYLRSVCQLDYATAGERLKQARELAGITLEEAAVRAYLKADALKRLEEESYFNTDTTDLQQLACLAYLYDVDLYWVFSGKARPPAAVLVDGVKTYPPYEFMLEQAPIPTAAGLTTTDSADIKLSKDEHDLLETYSYLNLVGKKETHKFIHYQLYQEQNLSSSSDLNHDENRGKLA